MRNSCSRLLIVAAAAWASSATASHADIPSWQIGPPVENLQTQFEKFATDGKMPSAELLVKGTSSNEMFTAYSAGVNHVQWGELGSESISFPATNAPARRREGK